MPSIWRSRRRWFRIRKDAEHVPDIKPQIESVEKISACGAVCEAEDRFLYRPDSNQGKAIAPVRA